MSTQRAMSAREWWEVRNLVKVGLSQREIARRLEINRRTVARMVAAKAPPEPNASHHRGSQLDPLVDTITQALAEDPGMKAPRLTALLRREHAYQGSVDLVRRRLAQLRAAEPSLAPPCGPQPGRLVEWDWTEMATRPWIGGVRRSVWALVASLPFSGAQTVHFSFDPTLESFLEGHVRVFDWLRGVPQYGAYAHLPMVVAKRDGRHALRWHRRFRDLRSHYAFSSSAYVPPADPAEPEDDPPNDASDITSEVDSLAGAVDRLKRDFWSTLGFKDLSELDRAYATWRDEHAHRGWDAANGSLIVAERLNEERSALQALPAGAFDFSVQRTVRVPHDGYVRHGASFYRAPMRLADERVELHASRDEVWMTARGARVATYPRSYKPGLWLPSRPD